MSAASGFGHVGSAIDLAMPAKCAGYSPGQGRVPVTCTVLAPLGVSAVLGEAGGVAVLGADLDGVGGPGVPGVLDGLVGAVVGGEVAD